MSQTVTLTIDDHTITVEEGTTILQACQRLQKEIPVFCYHPRLAVAGNCRMCLVEVEKMPKPVASCAMPVAPGMVVKTQTQMIENARKGVLEFLLINHPLDCPVCDQGGECDLQDITYNYSRGESRFTLNKRQVVEKYMGPLIKTVMNRCIHCTRCIRFANEIAGVLEVGAIHRGEDMEITTLEQAVTSELSGNLIDVCPVGALTSKPYAFHGRSWEFLKTDSIDVLDAVGSNIRIDSRSNKVMRILPRLNEEINEEWIGDKTRFFYDGLQTQRLDTPYIKIKNKLQPCSWEDAFTAIAQKFSVTPPNRSAALVGNLVDLETCYALRLLLDNMGIEQRDCREEGLDYYATHRSHYLFNSSIQGIERADCIILVGTNPRVEAPLIQARIRKRIRQTRTSVFMIGEPLDLTYPYHLLGAHPGQIQAYFEDPVFVDALSNASNPMIILGQACFNHKQNKKIITAVEKLMKTYPTFLQEGDTPWNGFNVLHTAASRVGALDVGFLPIDPKMHTQKILQQCRDGEISLLLSWGADEFALSQGDNTFIVYVGHHGDRGAHLADVILPSACFTEKEALYVNTEGRVQQTNAAVSAPGQAKEDWKIVRALSSYVHHVLPFDTLDALRNHMFGQFPHLKEDFSRCALPYEYRKFKQTVSAKAPASTTAFIYPIQNFYMTCSITRHSPTMAQCVTQILKKDALK